MDKEVRHRIHLNMLYNIGKVEEDLALDVLDIHRSIARLRAFYTLEMFDQVNAEKRELYTKTLEAHTSIENMLDELGDVVDLCI